MAKDVRCTHSGCGCKVPPERIAQGKRTCSDFCAGTAAAPSGTGCGCGHADCSVATAAQR
jgi:hypothetical protein